MSDIHLGLPYSSCGGLVDHSVGLAQDIGNLYLNCEYSDVVLVVAGQRFFAHKVILAARSNYFRAMMFGGLQESHQDEVEIKDANLPAFKVLLKYIYKGYIALYNEKEETVYEILALSHQYGFEELEGAVCDYLKETLAVTNFCVIYDLALLYCLNDLRVVCEDFLDRNAHPIVSHASFRMLSPAALKCIISRDSFCAPEVDIFSGVREWVEGNDHVDKAVMKEILSLIRLPLISLLDLLNVVRPSQLLSPDTILDAIKAKNESRDMDLRYRGYLVAEENVATPAKDAVVLTGEMKNNLLDGNTSNYDMDRGFTRHSIDDNPHHILVKLGRPCILNHFRLVLWDKDPRSYCYYIDVSMDQKDWVRVVDHTRYHCRSWQYLYFPARAVRYIKVVGTNNTVNRVFHLVAMEAYYTKQQVLMHQGLIVPTSNMALVSRSSVVIEGVSRSRNNLLNGDVTNYDWDSGYTCHQLGSGSICVQLGQPYWLGSLRLLLWDCDERSYSYYIHSSVNGRDWEVVADMTREPCRSWQVLQFKPRPVVYFKIVGVFNTANEVFHCVHFECPASTVECPITANLPTCAITNITATLSTSASPSGGADTVVTPATGAAVSINPLGQHDPEVSYPNVTPAVAVAAGPPPAPAAAGGGGSGDNSVAEATNGEAGRDVSAVPKRRGSADTFGSGESGSRNGTLANGNNNNTARGNRLRRLSPERLEIGGTSDADRDDDLRNSEFDLMAESNRSPGIDSDGHGSHAAPFAEGGAAGGGAPFDNHVSTTATRSKTKGQSGNGGGLSSLSGEAAPAGNGTGAGCDYYFGSVGNVARELLNPFIRGNVNNKGADASDSGPLRPTVSTVGFGVREHSHDDNHPAGDGGTDYSSLGARPRRSFRTDAASSNSNNDFSYGQNMPSYYNITPGPPLSSLHNYAQNVTMSSSVTSTSASANPSQFIGSSPPLSHQLTRTAQSSPTHSEYSFTRSSSSPTRSEYSNKSSRNKSYSIKSVNFGAGDPVMDENSRDQYNNSEGATSAPTGSQATAAAAASGGTVAAGAGGNAAGNRAVTLEDECEAAPLVSSPDSPAYHRPSSPLLLEPYNPAPADAGSSSPDAK